MAVPQIVRSRRHLPRRDIDTMSQHAIFVDIDSKSRTVQDVGATFVETDRIRRYVVAPAGIGQGQSPGDLRNDRRDMQRGRTGDARLAGLAGDVDLHAETVA